MATFLVKPNYGPVVRAREDQEELQDQDVDLINMGEGTQRPAGQQGQLVQTKG